MIKYFGLLFILFWGQIALAQEKLQIEVLFTKDYPASYHCKQILLSGKAAENYGLSLFKSMTLQPNEADAQEIERCVTADSKNAVDKEVGKSNGRLYYSFFSLKHIKGSTNAYIYYRNVRDKIDPINNITLIYMESKGDIEEIKRTFKQSSK